MKYRFWYFVYNVLLVVYDLMFDNQESSFKHKSAHLTKSHICVLYKFIFRFDYDDATFKMIMGMVSSNFKENILYSIPNTIPFVFRIGMQLRKVRHG